eukprot:3772940-Pyramimonas_sp.AAC.1
MREWALAAHHPRCCPELGRRVGPPPPNLRRDGVEGAHAVEHCVGVPAARRVRREELRGLVQDVQA